MKKKTMTKARLQWSFSLLFLILNLSLFSQDKLNIEKVGQLSYDRGLNDVWGYTDAAGAEYALVGLDSGVSIVDISVPSNPVEKIRIDGPLTVWRDLKTWSHYAYVTHDIIANGNVLPDQGLLVIDLDSLENPYYKEVRLKIDLDTIVDSLRSAHNLFIDENGVCYVFGSNVAKGGALLLDVATDPWNPEYLGIFNDFYFHDGMARGDTLWGAAIYRGVFAAVDVSDKKNPQVIATGFTPNLFTHNCWISDNGKNLFTTDERTDAYVASYDVSNLNSGVQELDKIQRLPGSEAIPHNVHVLGDWLITSYYTTGVQVVNAKRPELMVEVGYYDTYPQDDGANFRGNWGAYPYFPSGLIAASDRDNGLFILQPDYKDVAYADFQVSDSLTGELFFNTELYFSNENDTLQTDLLAKASKAVTYTGFDTVRVEVEGYQSRKIAFKYEEGKSKYVPIRLLKNGFTRSIVGDFIIYPNPIGNGEFGIAWPNAVVGEKATLEVYSNLGQKISSQEIVVSPENKFDVPKSSGVYHVRITGTSQNFSTQKILVL
jgi:choice-of-anchor B domain-containing protein